jgi:transcriptional regulator with XRE-family HTH domain
MEGIMRNAIVELFEESGMSVREFATAADLKYSTAHDIVTGKANWENIGAGAFIRIAHVFNTTADALFDGMENDLASLTASERELVSLYRNMQPEQKTLLMDNARAFSALSEKDAQFDDRIVKSGTVDALT